MSEWQIILLGAIAGGAIFLGLPIGRMKRPAPNLRHFLNAFAIGILVFLVWDVLDHAYAPLGASLYRLHVGTGSVGLVIGYAALFFAGLGVGLVGLTYYERFLKSQRRPQALSSEPDSTVTTKSSRFRTRDLPAAKHLAVLIAVGIGLHNFAEGLAIGQSAALGEISMATVLVIGFALHNATEGFGIVSPMTTLDERPSWMFLAVLGVIGGGPTVVGTAVGSQFTSAPVSVVFLTLAAGSILFVVLQLLAVAFRQAQPRLLSWGIFTGLVMGFVTDMIVTAAGA